jgi:glycosyltransferase involved in cell wall biosynthesis
MAMYASWFCRKKFKIVLTKHNTIPVTGAISRFRFKRFNDAVIFVSDVACKEAGFDYTNPRFHIVEHGIDLAYWKRNTPITTGTKLRMVSNAGTVRTKGWIHLARAIASLPKTDQERISVKVLGRYEPVLEEMQNEARELCSMEFPGLFPDPRPWLEDADIGFILSYREASSFALREMMSMSLPIIVSDYPVLTNSINAECGWVTKMKDEESIAAALRNILDASTQDLDNMKMAARRKAAKDFAIEKMLRETNLVYAGLFDR